MDDLGFGGCTNQYECSAACPKLISHDFIARLNRDYLTASFRLAFKPTPGGPEKLRFAAKLGLKVPDGKHRYAITVDSDGMVVHAAEVKNAPKPLMAAAEQEQPKVAATPPAPSPAPAATPASAPAATSAPASAPAQTEEEKAMAAAMTHEANKQLAGVDDSNVPPAAGDQTKPESLALRVAVYDLDLQGIDVRVGTVVTSFERAKVSRSTRSDDSRSRLAASAVRAPAVRISRRADSRRAERSSSRRAAMASSAAVMRAVSSAFRADAVALREVYARCDVAIYPKTTR